MARRKRKPDPDAAISAVLERLRRLMERSNLPPGHVDHFPRDAPAFSIDEISAVIESIAGGFLLGGLAGFLMRQGMGPRRPAPAADHAGTIEVSPCPRCSCCVCPDCRGFEAPR